MFKRYFKSGLLNVIIVSLIVILTAIFFGDDFKNLSGASLNIVIGAVVAISFTFAYTVFMYLQVVKPTEESKKTEESKTPSKEKSISEPIVHETNQDNPISAPLKEMRISEYSYPDMISLKRRDAINIFGDTEKRIKQEISSLNKRANINLIIGGFVALFGIVALVTFLLTPQFHNMAGEIALLIVHWVARLSLVSLVELFAFFFLKIYKTELLTIQYYQDELTSIESRKIALMFSVIHDCQEDVSKSIERLVNIDRNFKMDTTQTTVDLEKLKTENSFIKSQTDNMVDIIKGALSIRANDFLKNDK